MQDEVREKSVAFVIRVGKTGGKLTVLMLKYAMEQYLEQQRNPRAPHGRQSVKSLVRQGAGVQNIEITDKNIRSFQLVARKYGVDYALKKDTSSQPPRYLVFFKGRDVDVMTQAFKEFSAKTVKQKEKQSLKQKLSRSREQSKAQHKEKVKVKTKDRGVEL